MRTQRRNTLTLYRRHIKSCGKTKPTYFPATPKDRKADDCQCPIVCAGYLEHVVDHKGRPSRILHCTLQTSDWIVANERSAEMIASGRKIPEASGDIRPDANSITVKFAVDEYLKECKADNSKTGSETTRGYEQFLVDRLQAWCDENKIVSLKRLEDLPTLKLFKQTWKNLKVKDGEDDSLKPKTHKQLIQRLRTFLNYCVDQNWMVKNMAKAKSFSGVAAAGVEDDGDDDAKVGLELYEYQAVLNALDTYSDKVETKRLRAFVELGRWCGLRMSDLTKFNRSELVRNSTDTGWNASFIQWKIRKYKNRARCIVPVPDHVAAMLLELPYTSEDGNKKFWFKVPGVTNLHMHWYYKIMSLFSLAQKMTKPFMHRYTPHSLRHCFAIQNLNAGMDIRMVSKFLGHMNLATTIANYSHDTAQSKLDREEAGRIAVEAQFASVQKMQAPNSNVVVMQRTA
jgi:site-specific recombinase XerD